MTDSLKSMSDTQPLRVVTIGAGYFAQFHIEAWQRLPGAELVALCDLDQVKLESVAQQLAPPDLIDKARTYTDIRSMLDEIRPDLIDIATPPASHQELVAIAAEYRINAICQKPLAPVYAEALQVVELAEQAGITLAVHENFRFMPWHQEIARLISAGRLGKLHSISMRMRPGDGQGEQAYLQRQPYFQQMERFLIHETAIHFIDTFRFLCGEITGVFARLRRLNPVIHGEDAGYVLFEFENNMSGLFDGNRLNDHVSDNTRRTMGELWIEGEQGVLRLDGYGQLWLKPHGQDEAQHHYQWQDNGFAGDCVYRTQQHFLRHFRDGEPLQNSARDYLRNIEIEEAVYQSAESGQWLNVAR